MADQDIPGVDFNREDQDQENQDDLQNQDDQQGQQISSPNLQQMTVFISPSLVRLSGKDFTLKDPRIPIGLNDLTCNIILFYINNTESKNLGAIFAEAAETAAGINFSAINMKFETEIARSFVKVKSSPASPVHWAGLKQYPFILVYREGLPVASYNGERSVGAITNWALTLACRFDYTEMAQQFGGAQVENNMEMSGVRTYSDVFKEGSTKTDSTQFKASEDIRGYDASKGVKMVSKSEMKEVGDEEGDEEEYDDQGEEEYDDQGGEEYDDQGRGRGGGGRGRGRGGGGSGRGRGGELSVPSSTNLSPFSA